MHTFTSFIVRAVIALGLTALVLGQMDISPVTVLVIAFLATVVWSPLHRQGVA